MTEVTKKKKKSTVLRFIVKKEGEVIPLSNVKELLIKLPIEDHSCHVT